MINLLPISNIPHIFPLDSRLQKLFGYVDSDLRDKIIKYAVSHPISVEETFWTVEQWAGLGAPIDQIKDLLADRSHVLWEAMA
jgi:hypothetical protein